MKKNPKDRPKTKPSKTVSRDISILRFNERILQEAAAETTPLFERLAFLGIFSNNLDEFYRTRVSMYERTLAIITDRHSKGEMLDKRRKKVCEKTRQLFDEINQALARLYGMFDSIFADTRRALADEGYHFIDETQLTEKQGSVVRAYFHDKVRQFITPVMLDHIDSTQFLKDNLT